MAGGRAPWAACWRSDGWSWILWPSRPTSREEFHACFAASMAEGRARDPGAGARAPAGAGGGSRTGGGAAGRAARARDRPADVRAARRSRADGVTIELAYDAVQADGQVIEYGATRRLAVRRPDHIRVDAVARDGAHRTLVYDGRQLALADAERNVYATAARTGASTRCSPTCTTASSASRPAPPSCSRRSCPICWRGRARLDAWARPPVDRWRPLRPSRVPQPGGRPPALGGGGGGSAAAAGGDRLPKRPAAARSSARTCAAGTSRLASRLALCVRAREGLGAHLLPGRRPGRAGRGGTAMRSATLQRTSLLVVVLAVALASWPAQGRGGGRGGGGAEVAEGEAAPASRTTARPPAAP